MKILGFLKKKWGSGFNLTKRQKIIIVTLIITIGLLSTQTVNYLFLRYRFIIGLSFLAYLLSLWALWEGMNKLKAVVLLILPTMFTLAVASFYFLLPVRWLTRLPVALLFGVSFYSLLLSQNVFNVASLRTIPLYRAASTVSFLFTLVTAFFIFNVISGFDLPFYWNGAAVALISFPLILQSLWAVEMEKITAPIVVYSFILSLLVGEVGVALSFWPVAPTIWSLFLATFIYVTVGVVTEFMRDRLTKQTIWEYTLVGLGVATFSFLSTSWGG